MSAPQEAGGYGSANVEANGHLPQRVAEIAGQISEAEDESQRRGLARQIPQLAGSGGQAAARGMAAGAGAVAAGAGAVAAGAGAAWRGLQSGAEAVLRRTRPARDAAARNVQTGTNVAIRRVQETGGTALKGAQAGGAATWRGVRVSSQWLADQALDMAPRIPIRADETLRQHHPGMDTEQIAERLIANSAKASAGVGASVGAAAAVPFVPTMPLELGVETLALVAIELKLIAELHELYGQRVPGTARQRMLSYLTAWSERRGVRMTPKGGIAVAAGSPVQRQIEKALLKKASKSAFSMAPLLTGAAVGALIDHRDTRKLGNQVRDDLRKRTPEQSKPADQQSPGQVPPADRPAISQ